MLQTKQLDILYRLASLVEVLEQHNNRDSALKIRELLQKFKRQEYMIAFCGHFSAGKSSMLNELYGANLLPTSPIPTSANVVKIRQGKDRTQVQLKSGAVYQFSDAKEHDLQELCKEGDEIVTVEIARQNAPLPKNVILIDTPGVDSTDDAHRLATESTLHLADVIFYMMDYNHVQSEVNMSFIRELGKRGKTIFLIINQMDKHRESEISLSAYQKRVEETFKSWELQYEKLFFTSLKGVTSTQNDLKSVKNTIRSYMQSQEMESTISREVKYILTRYEDQLQDEWQEQKRALEFTTSSREQLRALKESCQHDLSREQTLLTEADTAFHTELNATIQSAYLMPYELREIAKKFLESHQDQFKVGLFFSRTKTEKEKKKRLQLFLAQLQQTVETQLDIHVRQFCIRYAKKWNLYQSEWGLRVQQFSSPISEQLLIEQIKQGAKLSGNYLLHYTHELTEAIKQQYKQIGQKFFYELKSTLQSEQEKKMAQMAQRLTKLETEEAKWLQLEQREQAQKMELDHLWYLWRKEQPYVSDEVLDALLGDKTETKVLYSYQKTRARQQEEEISHSEKNMHVIHRSSEKDWNQIEETLKTAGKAISQLPGLESYATQLLADSTQLKTRQFTIALFGAFSAGKSSFANACLGEAILPVSPNPTTAVVHRIVPCESEQQQNISSVQWKSEEMLWQEIQALLVLYEQQADSMDVALKVLPDVLSLPLETQAQKLAKPFLEAIYQQYGEMNSRLGSTSQVTLDELHPYIADEKISCFIEHVTTYYDGELTRQGITLVDTPGADSIHARHTDVAFQYIKQADALFFVTYYNHAFSQADREFLIQLGRVKDTFALDKMFFIINAADLAESPEELQQVIQYVRSQLQQYGIRNPRLFAVSSLQALKEQKDASGLPAFEQAFHSFVSDDLLSVWLHKAQSHLQQSEQLIQEMLTLFQGDIEEKQEQKKLYYDQEQLCYQLLSQWIHEPLADFLQQECKELLYYVKQRLFYRYQEMFTEIFNPTMINGKGAKARKQLMITLQEMIDFLRRDLLQEMRATSLRIEKKLREKGIELEHEIRSSMQNVNISFKVDSANLESFSSPEWNSPFPDMVADDCHSVLKYFRNSKAFFEKNEKTNFRQAFQSYLLPRVESYLQMQEEAFIQHYLAEWKNSSSARYSQEKGKCQVYYQSLHLALTQAENKADYQAATEVLQSSMRLIQSRISDDNSM